MLPVVSLDNPTEVVDLRSKGKLLFINPSDEGCMKTILWIRKMME